MNLASDQIAPTRPQSTAPPKSTFRKLNLTIRPVDFSPPQNTTDPLNVSKEEPKKTVSPPHAVPNRPRPNIFKALRLAETSPKEEVKETTEAKEEPTQQGKALRIPIGTPNAEYNRRFTRSFNTLKEDSEPIKPSKTFSEIPMSVRAQNMPKLRHSDKLKPVKPTKPQFLERKATRLNSIFLRKERTMGPDEDENLDDFDQELENVLISFPPFIINPYGQFKYIWDMCMIAMLMYFCFILPVRLCFRRNPLMFEADRTTDFDNEWLPFDILLDIVLVSDIILNFFFAYENDAGLIIVSKSKIMKHYMTHWFFLDLISTFPINRNIFHLPHIELEDRHFSMGNYKIWRITRFIKLVRVLKLNNSIEKIFSMMTLNVDKINIIKFASFITVFMHITACLWNAMAEMETELGWQKMESLQDKSIFDRYVSAIYFGLTVLLTIGFGNIHPSTLEERIVAIIWMFFGIIVYTYIISSLTSSFAKLNQTQSVQEEKDLFFREWNKIFRLPYETLDMVLNTIGAKNQSQSTQKMQALNQASATLANLPKALYSEIYNFFFEDVLNKVMFFQNKPMQFLLKLLPLLKPTNFNRGDYIYKERDPAMEIFFVVKGRVISKCLDRQRKERAQIYVEGSFFGEMDIFLKRNRIVSARAESNCELWKIDKEDFLSVLELFPSIKEEVEQLVKIKEAYRKPVSMNTKKRSSKFNEDEVPEENGIFSALTAKMIKKIQKGKYYISADNKHTYESLDFEPDLPSPETVDSTKNILSEDEWKNFEDDMTQRLVKKRTSQRKRTRTDELNLIAAGSLQKQFKYKNTGIKQRMLKHKADRETLRKSILVGARKGLTPISGKVHLMVRSKLLLELKEKHVEIDNIDEIDEMLNGKATIDHAKEEITEKSDKVETDFDKMLSDAESMLAALQQFQEGLEEMPDVKGMIKSKDSIL